MNYTMKIEFLDEVYLENKVNRIPRIGNRVHTDPRYRKSRPYRIPVSVVIIVILVVIVVIVVIIIVVIIVVIVILLLLLLLLLL